MAIKICPVCRKIIKNDIGICNRPECVEHYRYDAKVEEMRKKEEEEKRKAEEEAAEKAAEEAAKTED